ncbi:MAG: ATP-binding cassette domain-containing protein [Candidatus Latescibacteria bacterium]|nr:ATP-binding cassette domain-containing protein [Candidatus Latescibacterota bacterium]
MLELQSISKRFPGVRALDDVSLSFQPDQIHALVGENGAGKSTLLKIITGIYSTAHRCACATAATASTAALASSTKRSK